MRETRPGRFGHPACCGRKTESAPFPSLCRVGRSGQPMDIRTDPDEEPLVLEQSPRAFARRSPPFRSRLTRTRLSVISGLLGRAPRSWSCRPTFRPWRACNTQAGGSAPSAPARTRHQSVAQRRARQPGKEKPRPSNIALTFAEAYHRRVLVIDADLRASMVHEVFDISNYQD